MEEEADMVLLSSFTCRSTAAWLKSDDQAYVAGVTKEKGRFVLLMWGVQQIYEKRSEEVLQKGSGDLKEKGTRLDCTVFNESFKLHVHRG